MFDKRGTKMEKVTLCSIYKKLLPTRSVCEKNTSALNVLAVATIALIFFAEPSNAQKLEAIDKPPSLTLIIDDSEGMCGYLKNGSEFKKVLSTVQRQLEVSNFIRPVGRLLSAPVSEKDKGAIQWIDSLVNSTPKNCPFKKDTSPIGKFFSSRDSGPSVVLLTDLIFDMGKGSGIVDGRSGFVEEAKKWQSESQKKSTLLSSGFGVLAIGSDFEGTYWPASDKQRTVGIKLNAKRPLYLVWRTDGSREGAKIISELAENLKQVFPNNKTDVNGKARAQFASFTFSPFLSLELVPKFDYKISRIAEVLASNGNFEKGAPVVTYEFANNTQMPGIDAAKPELCIKWKDGAFLFEDVCSYATEKKISNSFRNLEARGLKGALMWFAVDDLPGIVRKIEPKSDYFNMTNLCRDVTLKEPKAEVLKELNTNQRDCHNSWLFQSRQYPLLQNIGSLSSHRSGTFFSIILPMRSTFVTGTQKSSITISAAETFFAEPNPIEKSMATAAEKWNSTQEPCSNVASSADDDCKKTREGTIGFELLIASLAGKLNPSDRVANWLNGPDKKGSEFSFTLKYTNLMSNKAK
jgi:hypothetical protein